MNPLNPDTLLPEQYFAGLTRHSGTWGEQNLMLAVLRDAVDCYQQFALARDPRGRAMFADAVEWIESNEREWLFSYVNICDVLGVDPAYLRLGLSKWRRQEAPRPQRRARIASLFERRLTERESPA